MAWAVKCQSKLRLILGNYPPPSERECAAAWPAWQLAICNGESYQHFAWRAAEQT